MKNVQRWISSLSRDPLKPSTITIAKMCEFGVYDYQMIVTPGEQLFVYCVDDGLIVAGFPGVTIQ